MRLSSIATEERPAAAWAAATFFLVLASCSLLRPLREEMGIAGGVEQLPWLFSATFAGMLVAVPLFSWVVARFRARQVVPVAFRCFAVTLLGFAWILHAGLEPALAARAFYVWVSIFNLLAVSVFWSLMADAFTSEQGLRLFGLVAAGGSLGAIAGPLMAGWLARASVPAAFAITAAALLEAGVACVARLTRWSSTQGRGGLAHHEEQAIGGGALAAIPLLLRSRQLLLTGAVVMLFTSTSTFAYLEQARIVRDAFDSPADRTHFFAMLDLAVNGLAALLQLAVTSSVLSGLGLTAGLAALPVLTAAGFGLLAVAPTPAVVAAFQAARRSLHHALDRPAREILFTQAGREERYKSKSFIDTVLYRGGDAASGWAHAGLASLGLSASAIPLAALPLCAAWLVAALHLGHRAARTPSPEESSPCPSPAAT